MEDSLEFMASRLRNIKNLPGEKATPKARVRLWGDKEDQRMQRQLAASSMALDRRIAAALRRQKAKVPNEHGG